MEDQLRYKKEMEEYTKNYIGRLKKTDLISKGFIEKLKAISDKECLDLDEVDE